MSWERQVLGLISEITLGVVTRRLYSAMHPRAIRAARTLATHLEELLAGSGSDTMTMVQLEGELFVEGRPFTRMGERVEALTRQLRRRGVERLTFARGVSEEEAKLFLDALAGTQGEFPALQHIVLGRLARDEGPIDGWQRGERPPVRFRDRVAIAREILAEAEQGNAIPVLRCEQLVDEIDRLLGHTEQPTELLAGLDEIADWPAVHGHNVAVMTSAAALSLEIDGETRRELAVAGLLHDVGKAGLPADRVAAEVEGRREECRIYPDHPFTGFEHILGSPQLPTIAAVVAFEHHLHQDGGGWPPLPRPREPHAAARLVAAADRLDVLHTARAPLVGLSREEIVASLEIECGSVLDPFLTRLLLAIFGLVDAPDT